MNTVVHVKKREVGKKSVLSTLRKNGFVPAVVYGYQIEPIPIAVNEREFERLLSKEGKNSIISLNIEGKEVKAVVFQFQKDTTKEKYIHVDFLSVDMSKLIGIEVPIVLKGLPIGVKEGGVLHQPLRLMKLIVKPNEIPEKVEIDVSNLAIGHALTIGDIRKKVKYTISGDDQVTLVVVSTPTVRMDLDTEITDQPEEAV
ncbi:50S ribosomal protein L25 [Rummeliibacillus sp. POC4]|uniref:50S ribosomal protein L25 n=1 Tax=Rummeliibacillus sp. POC4 TaxID=2305899 RepID=UPI000E6688B4|nr:50S ribosomal protein L25 [Rummeliibacillus sp. POC4]RIJ64316.1 50S ribosomal protein L25 [Rummeliibacillus sp. POC4]